MKKHSKFSKGFTLTELTVSLSVFIIVMTVSMGSILGIFDANRKSRSLKAVVNNLNLAVESMAKEMRYGKAYHCGASGTETLPQNCPSGDSFMSFLSSESVQTTYRKSGSTIEKKSGSDDYLPITAPEIIIDSLTFYTLGAGTTDTLQPKVVMMIKSHAGDGKGRSDFVLQTLISQRTLDI